MKRIELVDTTLRDGQQSPLLFDSEKYKFSLEEKKIIVEGLIKLGIKYIEMFSPIVGKAEEIEFKEIFNYAKSLDKNVKIICHCRCCEEDIKLALEIGFDGLNLFFGTSEHSISGHGKSIDFIKKTTTHIIKNLRQDYPNLYIRFSGEDAFRTDINTIYEVYDNLSEYCDTFGTPDTVGVATPAIVASRIKALKNRYPKNKLECHFHNDRGFALINSLTAVLAGADMIDTAIWGLAERSGIPSTTGMLLNLDLSNHKYVDGYYLENAYPLNVLLGSILDMQVPYTEPVSLTNRTHIAGVHAKSVLNSSNSYEEIDLGKYGVSASQILLGPLSGWNLISYYLKEVKNYELNDDQAKEITRRFKSRTNEITTKNNPETLLTEIAEEYGLKQLIVPKIYNSRRVEVLK
ncbi:pyruvate carboxyltransferase [Candidatus Dojkabacteria bacterium]|nr:pyruvate carboxyltransferase [Candidatus Dojkabacteria bacterium]